MISIDPHSPRPQPDWLTEHLQAKEARRADALARLWAHDLALPPGPGDILARVLYWALAALCAVVLILLSR